MKDYSRYAQQGADELTRRGAINENPEWLLHVTSLEKWEHGDVSGTVYGVSRVGDLGYLRELMGYALMRDFSVTLRAQDEFVKEHNPRFVVVCVRTGRQCWFRMKDSDASIFEHVREVQEEIPVHMDRNADPVAA